MEDVIGIYLKVKYLLISKKLLGLDLLLSATNLCIPFFKQCCMFGLQQLQFILLCHNFVNIVTSFKLFLEAKDMVLEFSYFLLLLTKLDAFDLVLYYEKYSLMPLYLHLF